MAISLNDKSIAKRFPNCKIMQKAFNTGFSSTIHDYSSPQLKQKERNWSHTTIRGCTQKYNSYIKPNWRHLLLTYFKPSMFDVWASESLLSGKSINETRNVLNQIFKRAFYDSVIESNPAERIERYKQKTNDPKPINLPEVRKILIAFQSPYGEFCRITFYTALRTGELLGLR